MNKRRYERIKVNNASADLSDGRGFFSGTVSDISCSGMLLEDVPKQINNQAKKLTLVVSANGKNLKILGITKWVHENNLSQSMGIEILQAPVEWNSFIKQHEPKEVSDDVWGGVAFAR